MPQPGDPAPDFSLPGTGHEAPFALRRFRGRKVVLFFYPKDDTSGCTREAREFDALAPAFAEADTVLLGASACSLASHRRFSARHGLSFPLLSDEGRTALDAYGVWTEKRMYGHRYMGIERTTILIDREGHVARVWPKVKVPGHAAEVLEAAQAF